MLPIQYTGQNPVRFVTNKSADAVNNIKLKLPVRNWEMKNPPVM